MADGGECHREEQSMEERHRAIAWGWFAIRNRRRGQIPGKDHSRQREPQVQMPLRKEHARCVCNRGTKEGRGSGAGGTNIKQK